ncbi:MAG: DUF5990 family protein [Capsulimonadales bacterium]|nr:DUF5990 family protein [Capsulimonadales bacterium]
MLTSPPVTTQEILLTLRCHSLPSGQWGGHTALRVGVQERDMIVQDAPVTDEPLVFTMPVRMTVAPATEEIDFGGPFVHGRRGERFLYLCWGERDAAGNWHGVRRAKIPLARLDRGRLLAALRQPTIEFSLRCVDAKGGPICATVPPDAIEMT